MPVVLTKADIIRAIHEQTGVPLNVSKDIFESLLDIIKKSLENGEDVLISGFGKFSVKEKDARKGRNPQTGEALMIEPRRVVTFTGSRKLRDVLDGE